MRLLVLVAILFCYKVLVTHMIRGDMGSAGRGFKVFWMQFCVALGGTHNMQLAALSRLFDISSPNDFHSAPVPPRSGTRAQTRARGRREINF